MKSLTIKAFTSVAAVALLACGCAVHNASGSTAPASAHELVAAINAQPADNIKQGGELNLSAGEIPEQLNPFQANANGSSKIFHLYNPQLSQLTADGQVKFNTNYLESVSAELVDGKTVVTYKINPKASFNDGTPIDYTAFANTQYANSGKAEGYEPNGTAGYELIESVKAGASPKEVIVTFNQAYPRYDTLFDHLLHPKINTAELFNNAYTGGTLESAHPELGGGPYIMKKFDQSAGVIVYERNDKYFGTPGKLDRITLTLRDDTTAAINAFKNGESDAVGAGSASARSQVTGLPDTEIRMSASTKRSVLLQNVKSDLLSDVVVRKAIATGMNRKQLAETSFQGTGYTEDLPGSAIFFPFQDGYQDNFSKVVPNSDPEAARKLLEDAGYTKGADGIYGKNGKTLRLRMPMVSPTPEEQATHQALQQQMKNIGIDVKIEQKSSKDFMNIMNNYDFDLFIAANDASDPNVINGFCQLYCSDEPYNKARVGTPELDQQIRAADGPMRLQNTEDQAARANELETKEMELFGYVPLFDGFQAVAVHKDLANAGAGGFATAQHVMSDFIENVGFQKDA